MDFEIFLDTHVFDPLHKPLGAWRAKEYTIAILSGIAVGTILVSVLAAPNLAQVFTLFKTKNRKERYRLANKMRYLERAGYMSKTGTRYALTQKGRAYLDEAYVWGLVPRIPKRWDKKWHFVAFDIPGEKHFERARQALRTRLAELGFARYQDSLLVHRYDMRDVIEPFAAFYGIKHYLVFIAAVKIDNEHAVAKQCPVSTA